MALSVKSILSDRFLPYFEFGQRWLLLLPVVGVPALFSTVKLVSATSPRQTLLHPAFVFGSVALVAFCCGLYVRLTGPPPRTRFRIVVASFQQVGAKEQLEADKLRDRLVESLNATLRPAITGVEIRIAGDKVDGRSARGRRNAESLAIEYRAHMVLGGTLRVDEQYYFAPFILTRFSHPFEPSLEKVRAEGIERGQSLSLKERKIGEEVRLASLVAAIALIDAERYQEAEDILVAGTVESSAARSFYRGIAQLELGKTKDAFNSFIEATELNADFRDAWMHAAIAALKLNDREVALTLSQKASSTHGGVLISGEKTHVRFLRALHEDILTKLEGIRQVVNEAEGQRKALIAHLEESVEWYAQLERKHEAERLVYEAHDLFKARQYEAAVGKFNAAVAIEAPFNYEWHWADHASALLTLDRHAEAYCVLGRSLMLPSDADGRNYFQQARVYAALGRKTPMLSQLAAAIDRDRSWKTLTRVESEFTAYADDGEFKQLVARE